MSCPICRKDIQPSIKSSPMLTDGHIFDYAICKDCGVAYHEPPMSAIAYEAYPEWGWQNPGKVPYATKAKCDERAAEQFEHIKTIRYDRESVFDVGTGAGGFIYLCQKAGWVADGCDASLAARIKASEYYGLKLGASPPDRGFNIVCLHSVLEHVWDAEPLLTEAINALSENGRLLIKIPAFNFQKQGWWAYAPEHPCLYTKHGITKLLAEYGCELTRQWPQGKRAVYLFEAAA